ncbi:MAG TPA: hypothetical protein VEC01_05380 [Noviherbaspirillum sp.]|uniref:hypothetical protein n=1 Tax=Noviherbaspirillum sp. TaxID=1926288 RepID=UPI002D3CE674|nr:hypothetical protein [Noviherbaspirillum sp.]HYD94738.1 hypothetical protein [Noviherbaspirillum sp.]
MTALDETWAKMPCTWQTDARVHAVIRSTPCGEAIAALKLYIAFCLKANYKAKEELPAPGCVRASLTQLCTLIRTSRPMVVEGLRHLESWGLINKLGGRPAVYQLCNYENPKYWTKLPKFYLFGDRYKRREVKAITALPNREAATVDALQMYLYLASVRDKNTHKATVTYDKMQQVLKLGRNQISHGISTLTGHELITARREGDLTKLPSNVYWLRGTYADPVTRAERSGQAANDFSAVVDVDADIGQPSPTSAESAPIGSAMARDPAWAKGLLKRLMAGTADQD